ncbi:MAG: AAA family ATPase [Acidobacteria bacterium]|nr:MAG: AAA family ATPase [Acidobacteriota bacterium]
MLREQTFEKLYKLKLHGMAQALEEQLKQPETASLCFEERLAMLVDAQWTWRENQAIANRLRNARLKQQASIEDINYRHPRQLDRALMRSLAGCDWVRQRHNVTITGPSGVGKTYVCCALLEKACREGFTAHYVAASKFFRKLALAYADGSFDRLLSKLAKIDVLAVDDWGLTALSDTERRYFLEVLEDRCGSRSTVLTSQFPVETWHDLVGSPTLADAIMERILSNNHEIALKGETLRPVRKAGNGKATASSQRREEEP